MQLKRILVLMLAALALAACGAGDVSPTTPPTDSDSGPAATSAPATTDATPASDSSGSSGSFDLSQFPAPPNGGPIKEGEDPVFDMLIATMGPTMAEASKQQGGVTTEPVYFKSTASVEEIGQFYAQELPALGLQDPGMNQPPMSGTLSQVYVDQSLNGGVVVMAFDGSTMGATGTLVMAVGFNK